MTPEQIYNQIITLTRDIVSLSLCDHQNFPSIITLQGGCKEICLGKNTNISIVLKNISYYDMYCELANTGGYNLKMLDGALIQMMYYFKKNVIERHRLAFFPSPSLEEFQNNPDIYNDDEIYAEVIDKNIVPFPIRFDYDCREDITTEIKHPKSHLTLGQYKNCRIPVSGPLTPHHFLVFILRNFYHTVYNTYSDKLTCFSGCFNKTITNNEQSLLFMQIPLIPI